MTTMVGPADMQNSPFLPQLAYLYIHVHAYVHEGMARLSGFAWLVSLIFPD